MKMKFTLVTLLPLLAAASAKDIIVSLANDQSGANAGVKVPADGAKHHIKSLWGDTAVAQSGVVKASSAQLTSFETSTVCKITKHPNVDVTLNSRQTWASFDHQKVVELNDAVIICHN